MLGAAGPAMTTFSIWIRARPVAPELVPQHSCADWLEARSALLRLHRLVFNDVTVIPLYQTFDYYASRKTMNGLTSGQATLYQTVENWKASARFSIK